MDLSPAVESPTIPAPTCAPLRDRPFVFGPLGAVALVLLAAAAQLSPFLLGDAMRPGALFGDEPRYWLLSGTRGFDFLRPPGYPAFLLLVRLATGDAVRNVWIVQSLLLAFRPLVLAGLLAAVGVSNRLAVAGACVLCAFSLTGASVSKVVNADALFGLLAPAAFLLAWKAARTRRMGPAIASSALAAAALALKPAFEVWVVVAPLLVWLGGARRASLCRLGTATVALPLALFLAWSAVMKREVGVFRYSGIGDLAVSRYWSPATEAVAQRSGKWVDADVSAIRERRDSAFGIGASVEPPLRGAALASARRTIVEHPGAAVRVLFRDIWTNLPRPFHPQEWIFSVPRRPWAAPLGKGTTYAVWILAAGGAVAGSRRTSTRNAVLAVLTFAAVFAAASSISFWVGARLTFPAEWTLFALAAIAIDEFAGRPGAPATARFGDRERGRVEE